MSRPNFLPESLILCPLLSLLELHRQELSNKLIPQRLNWKLWWEKPTQCKWLIDQQPSQKKTGETGNYGTNQKCSMLGATTFTYQTGLSRNELHTSKCLSVEVIALVLDILITKLLVCDGVTIGFVLVSHWVFIRFSWVHIGFLSGIHWVLIRFSSGSYQVHIGFLLGPSWVLVGFLLVSCRVLVRFKFGSSDENFPTFRYFQRLN